MPKTEVTNACIKELQDEILDFTILIKPSTVTITADYKPPVEHQISRATRQKAARHYYSTSDFSLIYYDGRQDIGEKRIQSLTQAHRDMITNIYLHRFRATNLPNRSLLMLRLQIQCMLRRQAAGVAHENSTAALCSAREEAKAIRRTWKWTCDLELPNATIWANWRPQILNGEIEKWISEHKQCESYHGL